MAEDKPKMVTLHRDPNVGTSVTFYNNGDCRYKFDIQATTFEVLEEHAPRIVRDCADLRRSVVKLKRKPEKKEASSTEAKPKE